MNDEYEGDGFKPLRTTTSWTSLPDKDSEIARLKRIIDAERDMQAKLVAEGTRLSAEIAKLGAALDKERAATLRDLHRELIECGREWQVNGHRPTHDDYLRQVDLAARRAAEAKE